MFVIIIRRLVPFLAKLVDSPSASPARGTLYMVDAKKPVALVDIDGTISDLPSWRVVFRADRAKTYPGAPELIRDLAKTHQIVYLTARDDHFASVSRARRFIRRTLRAARGELPDDSLPPEEDPAILRVTGLALMGSVKVLTR